MEIRCQQDFGEEPASKLRLLAEPASYGYRLRSCFLAGCWLGCFQILDGADIPCHLLPPPASIFESSKPETENLPHMEFLLQFVSLSAHLIRSGPRRIISLHKPHHKSGKSTYLRFHPHSGWKRL